MLDGSAAGVLAALAGSALGGLAGEELAGEELAGAEGALGWVAGAVVVWLCAGAGVVVVASGSVYC